MATSHAELSTGFEALFEEAMADVDESLRGTLGAVSVAQRVVALQCIYYAHMFLVLREHALRRRLKLEKRRKKKLMANFAGSSERQDAYLARRQEMMKGWGLDKVTSIEGDEMAQIDGMVESLEATIGQEGRDVTIGIVGCGTIGLQLLRLLLQCGTFTPGRILVSTRSPEGLLHYQVRACCTTRSALAATR
eukprot:SAG11_NODE_4645_length_1822_cov_2.436448_1_plen_192_part_00